MTSMRLPQPAPVVLPLGAQQPRIRSVPEYSESAGIEAIQAYELTGRRLDEWQKAELIDACGEREDGRWAAFEVAFVDPRQNGKDEEILARELAGLFVWGERLIGHSAHLFDTAMEHLERLAELIENVPEFCKRCRSSRGSIVNRSHGHEGITLKSGARIRFRARTRSGSFRGFTGDCMIFNEAMDLPDPLVGSIMPVLSARSTRVPGPQVLYAASAVDQQTMPHGLVLTRVRDAAINGTNDRLAYFEHSAGVREWLEDRGFSFDPSRPEVEQITHEMLADPEMWAQANPALGVRISHEHVRTEFQSPSMSGRQFAIERLGIGDWPDVSGTEGRVISVDVWVGCEEHDPGNRIEGVPTFAIDGNLDETWGSIAVAGTRPDGLIQGAIVQHARGTDWLVDECVDLKASHRRAQFVVDKRGPVAHLIPQMKAAKLRVIEASTEDYGNACHDFVAVVKDDRFRYPAPQPDLDEALANARKATLGERWKWSRRDSTSADISPVVALTLAVWGHCSKRRSPQVINLNDL